MGKLLIFGIVVMAGALIYVVVSIAISRPSPYYRDETTGQCYQSSLVPSGQALIPVVNAVDEYYCLERGL